MQQIQVKNPIREKLLDSAKRIETIGEFKQWTRDYIRPILPHASMACGVGRVHAGGITNEYIVQVDFPENYIDSLRNRAGAIETPIVRRWLAVQEPILFDSDNPWPEVSAEWLNKYRAYKLRNTLAHAVIDVEKCLGSYHSVYRVPGSPGTKELSILGFLTPLLHQVICRVIENLNKHSPTVETRLLSSLEVLTKRETAVLRLLMQGKTNSEIAQLMAMSENTVKHHLTCSYEKLQVKNRTQLMHRLTQTSHSARIPQVL